MIERTLSTPEAAQLLGISEASLKAWIKLGAPHDKAPLGSRRHAYRWNPSEVRDWARSLGLGRGHGGDRTGVTVRQRLRAGLKKEASDSGQGLALNSTAPELDAIADERSVAKLRKDLALAERAEVELDAMRARLLDAGEVRIGIRARQDHARRILLEEGDLAALAEALVGRDQAGVESTMQAWVHERLTQLAS